MAVSANSTAPSPAATGDTREGFYLALTAYLLWGLLPFYMKAVAHIPAIEVLAHRILWSVPVAGLVILVLRRTGDLRLALASPRMVAQAALTAMLVAANWGIYVWAIAADRALETALGYYINPLFSVFLAAVLLGERLVRLQLLAIGFAVAAVALLTWHAGGLPWVSLALTFTWGFYALFKKTLPVGPTQGFFLEVMLLTPPALAFAIYLAAAGQGHFLAGDWADTGLLAFAGIATAVPLLFYAAGAKLLRLSTIAIMQYIAPTAIFLIAVFVFEEPFDLVRLAAFTMIWTALALYSWSLLSASRRARKRPAAETPNAS